MGLGSAILCDLEGHHVHSSGGGWVRNSLTPMRVPPAFGFHRVGMCASLRVHQGGYVRGAKLAPIIHFLDHVVGLCSTMHLVAYAPWIENS